MRCKIMSAVLLCLLVPATTMAWTDLGLFHGPNANLEWRAPDGSALRPTPALYAGDHGLRMDIRMPPHAERVYRDVSLNLDLSSYTEFAFAFRSSNPDAISRCTLFFKSGAGWYGGWFTLDGPGWQTITLPRGGFAAEGSPAGWHQISGVRLSIGKGITTDVRIEFARLRARTSPLLLLRNSNAIRTLPAEKAVVERAVERLRLWYEGIGIHVGIIDDEALAASGPPPGARLIILPYNPAPPPETVKRLKSFADKGGKLIVIYALPPELAPLLGLTGKHWMKAEPPDIFSSIAFPPPGISGVPAMIRQQSWNANIPAIQAAEVLGTWVNGEGKDAGLPAVTRADAGIFIGHVLTNIDREHKMQMLLAFAADLAPDLKPFLAAHLRAQAGQLFKMADWTQTRAFIDQTADRYGNRRNVARLLKAIDQYWAVEPVRTDPSFADLHNETIRLQGLVRQAYFEAVGAVPASQERRGIWSHNAAGIPGQSWKVTARTLRQSGFNLLFGNHQWAGTAYYPSAILPESPLVHTQGDLLKQALEACHQEGIAFHLWSVLWVLENAPDAFVANMEQAGRLMKDRNGNTVKWLCPAHPLNADLAVRAAVDVVRNYAVDGFHLDYARYPDANACYCQTCATRFRADTGQSASVWPQDVVTGRDRDTFLTWRRQQMTDTVIRIHRELKALRPSIQLSAAVWSGWPGVRDSIGQDWVQWCRDGLLDFVCPMNYVTSAEEAVSLFTAQRRHTTVPIYPGIAPTTHNLAPEETVRQVERLRQAGAKGFVLFELDPDLQKSHLPALRAGATSK